MEKNIRILLLDEEPTITGTVTCFLEKENLRFLITTVPSEKKFYLELKGKKRDVILICVDIPGGRELSLIENIRFNCPFIPVFIISNECPTGFAAELFLRGITFSFYISIGEFHQLPEKIESAWQVKKRVGHCTKAYDDLLRKEQEISGILDNIQDAYFRTDKSGFLSTVNKAGITMFGYDSEEEIIGQLGSMLYCNENDREYLLKTLRENEHITDYISKGKRKNGTEFWASMNAQIVHDKKGDIIGTEGIVRDISERLKDQDELNLKAHLLDNSFDSILVFDFQGNILYANENACKLRGYSREELLKKNLNDLIVPGYIPKFNSELARLKTKNEVLFELAHIRKDHSILQVEVKLRNFSFQGKDLILHSSVDISERKMAVDALVDSETRYRDLTESSPIGILTTDLDGIIVYENPAMRRILGVPDGQVSRAIGMNLAELPYLKDTKFADLFQNVSKGFPIKDLNLPFESIYGIQTFLRVNGIPIRNSRGKITGNLLIIQDITEQYKMEEALKESQEKFSSLTESSQDPIYLVDQDCRYLYANQSYLNSYGLTLDSIIDKDYCDFHDDQESSDFSEKIRDVIKTSLWMTYEHYSSIDGRYFIRTLSPILGNNKSKQVTVVSKDITERKITEEALIREKYLLQTLIEHLPNAVFAKDLEYRKVIINSQHIESVLGHLEHLGLNTKIDLLGKTDFEVFPKELAEQFFVEDQKVIREGISIINNLEFGASRKGEKIWNLVSKIPLRDSKGEITGMVGITTDITELKNAEFKLLDQKEKLEKQNQEYILLNREYKKLNEELQISNEELLNARIKAEESDRLKTAFLQNMSHEIRTPMNAIMGFSELLVHEFENKVRLEQFANIIYQRSSDLLDIINGILDISKIESGQLPVHYEKFELHPVFEELEIMFNEYRKRIKKELVEFSLSEFDKGVRIEINSDKVKLKQIFINLIGNAYKFTEKGKIEAGYRFSDKDGLVFFVSDTGIGIPKEKHALIFERFVQITDKTISKIGGTGLGLSIVQGLLKLLGGKIWLESEPGVGSTFYFTVSNRR